MVAAGVAALAIGGCGSGGDASSARTGDQAALRIGMAELRFHPSAVTARVGQTVTWNNDDSVDHNVTADSGARFHSRAFGRGKTYRFRPTRAGTIRYECTLHPGMRGTIAVR